MGSIPTMSHSCAVCLFVCFFNLTLFPLTHSIFCEISFLTWTLLAALDLTLPRFELGGRSWVSFPEVPTIMLPFHSL